jgi:type IX secretion system PorP/SprF family membrane protein
MRTKIIKFVLLLTVSIASYGQQDAQFTQYMYNTININPAYAGSKGSMSVFVLHRTQWVGLSGAPVSNTASINTPLTRSKLGLGISVINDEIGPSNENNLAADLSYTIDMSERYKLAFGLKGSINLLNVNFNELNQENPDDSVFNINIDNKFTPNIGIGFYLYSDNTYIGLSAPHLLETQHFDRFTNIGSQSSIAKETMNIFLIAGHVFDVNRDLQFKPSLLTKYVQGAPLQVDISANFLINERFTAGLAYRLSAAVSALMGVQVDNSWYIGYGYDLETTKLSDYNSGSHEIFLRYELPRRYDKVACPRFF